MSLFGGDGAVPEPESPIDRELEYQPATDLSSPQTQDLPEVYDIQPVPLALVSDEDDDFRDDTDSELEPVEEPSRPNRFTGKAPTWKGYTAADRQIVASLEQITSADLAAHAYNAHALRRRARLPADKLAEMKEWYSKNLWLRRGRDLEFTDAAGEVQTELIPYKLWTAWPLPPDRLPPTERGMVDDEGGWVIPNAEQVMDAGGRMRDELLAVFLREAKETWRSRKPETDVLGSMRSQDVQSHRSGTDFDAWSTGAETDNQGLTETEKESSSASGSEKKRLHSNKGEKDRQQRQAYKKPVILADDERGQQILQASINSLLTSLDHVAGAIRRNRYNHYGRGAYRDTSGSEFTSDAESRSSRSPSKSRSVLRGNTRQASTRPPSRKVSAAPRNNSKAKPKKRKSKPKPKEPRYDSDSASDYGAEFEKHDGDKVSESSSSDPPTPSRRREASASSGDGEPVSNQAGLIDWSEVLGMASMTGWNPNAVARTAQRCAALFGETMRFTELDEGLAAKPTTEPISAGLSTIPAPNTLASSSRPAKRPLFETGTLRCPHADCWGSKQDFAIPYRTVEHVKRVHGYDPRDNDSDNEERKVGGVHKDGFLQPITAKQGWLGGGRSKSGEKKTKRRKKEVESDTDDWGA
ncbi:hypothetical protein BS50DRAFT_608759 [Corynespora cassiicola Philippines]|uniref:Rrn9 domain-containing protein n=1 Tax=Corynespora cassiicola Philippines TaxID=1448308 RepID=A0A2T2NXL0_CORCC|nr:hypothetical protein BS50DRAFT_608759 [Corynespora cassiicola Philippines]